MLFTKENPPKSGTARKLWDWFTEQEFTFNYGKRTKESGSPPDILFVVRAGYRQRQAGAARYSIDWQHTTFYIHDPNATLAGDAKALKTDTWYYL